MRAAAYAFALIILLSLFPMAARSQPVAPPEHEHHDDAFVAPPPSPALLAGGIDLRGPSQFMAGEVAVLLVLPESTGAIDPSREDWTPEQIAAVAGQVQAALDWWDTHLPLANLSFQLRVQVVPTDYEPTSRPLAEEGLWIGDTLRRLGFGGASHFDQAYAAADALRDELGADWGTVVFVPNSANGAGYLADGRFAYAYINGPFSVITSDAGGHGAANLAHVVAHELGHTFGALDQYPSARVGCEQRSGYLNAPTSNSQYGGCGTQLPSIMLDASGAFVAGQIDPSALAQLGYRDGDGDGVIDPLDTTPAVELQERALAAGTGRPVLRGVTRDIPFPSALQNDVTLNTIRAVEYRVDGGHWLPMDPADGAFDSAVEEFGAELPLYDGRFRVEVRAVNSAGTASATVERQLEITTMGPAPRYAVRAPAAVAAPAVPLALVAPPTTTGVQVSEDPGFRGATWQPYRPEVAFPLPGADGPRMLYVRFRDQFGLASLPLAATAVLDTAPPTGSALRPPAEPTRLLLSAQDASTAVTDVEVQVGDGAPVWMPYAPSLALPQAAGEQPVAVRFRDAAGNVSPQVPAPLGYRVALPLVRR
jgi:hypothetical protein